MTSEQFADALLCAAKNWQNEEGMPEDCKCQLIGDALFDFASRDAGQDKPGILKLWLHEAGCALSEVAALGFDIETVES